MSKLNPRKPRVLESYGKSMKLQTPLVFDEHYPTTLTVFTEQVTPNINTAQIRISVEGPLIIKDDTSDDEKKNLTKQLFIPGNGSFHVQSPREYDYPSGLEGDCCAQASICVTKIETIGGNEVQW